MEKPLMETEIKEFELYARGKVRDIYDLKDKLLIIATDRISAFDCVLPDGIPGKGKILTQMSLFWFDFIKDIIPTHLITADPDEYPKELKKYKKELKDRSMLVRKAKRINVECVVRGYIAGSFWKEYQEKLESFNEDRDLVLHGIFLSPRLKESEKLPSPVFTPATKVDKHHDLNISFDQMVRLIGRHLGNFMRDKSIKIYQSASTYAEKQGIIIADTKFEFGISNGQIILIDEILSPDSSRFWPVKSYKPGKPQDNFDKQYVRDFLEKTKWDKKPPAPNLPAEVIKKTKQKYKQAHDRLVKAKVTETK
ncbi:MAG: phosphoribosylaminoimidazolesuccinocarboxamide synthase [Candidatus Zixiibacteriota bacterium]